MRGAVVPIGIAAIAAIAACAGSHPAPKPPPRVLHLPTPAERAENVPFGPEDREADLAALRDALRDVYAHLDEKRAEWGVDVDQMFARYAPQIRAADTWTRYEQVMVAFVSELHDGHVTWRRHRAAPEGKRRIVRLGLDTVWVGDHLIVSNVWPGSAVERAGLARGDEVISVDGHAMADWAKAHASIRSWSAPDAARHDFADAWAASRVPVDQPLRARTIVREAPDGRRDTLAILPETTPRPGVRPPAIELAWDGDIAILRVHTLKGHVAETKQLASSAAAAVWAKPQGLVVDLRDNDGGFEDGAKAIVALLTSTRVVGATARVRLSARAREAQRAWRDLPEDPAKPGWSELQPIAADGTAPRPYPAKIAVVTDAGCASSCETLALLLRAAGARLYGERTAGAGGAPVTVVLPRSGARVSIPARVATDPTGAPIEGRGVLPDEELAASRDDVIAGRDAVLARAVAGVRP